MKRLQTIPVPVGSTLVIGGGHSIVVQTMCNTHTSDVQASVAQCRRLAAAGAQLIRLTVPGPADIEPLRAIRDALRAEGIDVPLVADIHFSSQTAMLAAEVVEKVRINPGNFHPDHEEARRQFRSFLEICKRNGTAVRIGLNHGSLGKYITERYGNTPQAMAEAAMEWLRMCLDADFTRVVVSLKASNTVVMVEAYRALVRLMQASGTMFPLHVGVTEAGNGDSGRIKSCVGISSLLSEGIGDTVRVSLTEDPEAELPVARYLSERYSGAPFASSMTRVRLQQREAVACYEAPSRERLLLDLSCDWGRRLLDREIDSVSFEGLGSPEEAAYLQDELLQAARRRFYKPEYIACPGCGRTMYNLQEAFETVKARTAHLKGMVIAVMGCIVNGPGEMADADWGYVGEGGGKVSIYRGKEPVLRHVPEAEAVDRLLELIEAERGFRV
ncbi:MAG: (E)-4-hydroxy-3-methylbut-2-enyl-diphosphate synthase [Bacteroidales bacterium]|nr:(E)-4-hydroxy-3-methylbut-2-enyl-diphosphate synthase [Bacteroidales bacterium]